MDIDYHCWLGLVRLERERGLGLVRIEVRDKERDKGGLSTVLFRISL